MLRKYLGMLLGAIGFSSAHAHKGNSAVAVDFPNLKFERNATTVQFAECLNDIHAFCLKQGVFRSAR